jgi:hypothetical protein
MIFRLNLFNRVSFNFEVGNSHGNQTQAPQPEGTPTPERTIMRFAKTSKRNNTEGLYQCVPKGRRRNCTSITANR